MCNSIGVSEIILILKRILNLVQLIGPILFGISLVVLFTKLVVNPDDKKLPKKIVNSIMAILFLYATPIIINAAMLMLDESFSLSSCWNSVNVDSAYKEEIIYNVYEGKEKNKINITDDSFEKGDERKEKSSNSTGNTNSNNNSNTNHSNGNNNSSTNNPNNSSNSNTNNNSNTGITTGSSHTSSKSNIKFNIYYQSDSSWANTRYPSGSTIKQTGCMITSIAVVSSAGNSSVTPLTVFNSKYRHSYPYNAINALGNGKFSCKSGSTNTSNIINELNNGNVVVIKVFGRKKGGSSKFTTSQHYMALIDISGDKIFVGNGYSSSGHGLAGWFNTNDVLTSVKTADYCIPSNR